MAEVAQRLGVTKRTLARRLASEGRTFGEVLDGLRFDLATPICMKRNCQFPK
jgi:AraC-like DNA-binding protein